MNSHYVQLSQAILMLDAQGGEKMTLLTQQGKKLTLTSSPGHKKVIDKPTHVINNSIPCIDFIFCTNQNVISNYGVDVSMVKKCHHNIIHCKIDIRVSLPPVYVREVWDYNKQYLILIGTGSLEICL